MGSELRAFWIGAVLGTLLLASFVIGSCASGQATRRSGPPPPSGASHADVIRLRGRNLLLPIAGLRRGELRDSFGETRGGRRHEAIDIAARRGTPVLAVDDGVVERLARGGRSGLSVRQLDPTASYRYFYAHLDAYAAGLRDGASLRKGELIGFVGSTGNARDDAPHLHFAIFELRAGETGSLGVALNPYRLFAPPA